MGDVSTLNESPASFRTCVTRLTGCPPSGSGEPIWYVVPGSVHDARNASIAGALLVRPPRFPGRGMVVRSTGVAVNVIGVPLLGADAMLRTVLAGLVGVVDAFLGMGEPYRLSVVKSPHGIHSPEGWAAGTRVAPGGPCQLGRD